MLSPSDELFAVVRCTIVRAKRSFRYGFTPPPKLKKGFRA